MKKFLLGVIISAVLIACSNEKTEEKAVAAEPPATDTKKPATEVLDLSEADGVKAGSAALANKDIAGMTATYADDVRYRWSAGDSLIGKQAVADYWNGRMKLIDSINFSETIVLPIRINESQSPQYATVGKWVLVWNFSHVKYKNGKWLHFWVHTDYHYNDAGKIDAVIQYIDRHPVMEATKGL
jgi:hypothetical protein